MKSHRLPFGLAILVLLLLATVSLPATANDPGYKQLAAPPEEIAAMQLPSVETSGVKSHSAMLPVTLVNGQWSGKIAIESADQINLMALSNGQAWDVSLTAPSGIKMRLNSSARSANVAVQETSFGTANQQYAGTMYTLKNMESGQYAVSINAKTKGTAEGFLLYANEAADTKLMTHLADHRLVEGNTIGLVSYAVDADGTQVDRSVSATVTLVHPDGSTSSHAMNAADGKLAVDWADLSAGTYTAQITASGINSAGEPFVRTTEHVFPVVRETIRLNASASAKPVSSSRLQIDLEVAAPSASGYLVSAELWGTRSGEMVPLSWIGGLSDVSANTLPISVDGRWIGRASATAPFELRNVRLQDRNTLIPVAEPGTISLATSQLPASASARSSAITADMLMGERPTQSKQRSAMADRLMLVHGYCSGDVWNSGHFTNDIKFKDYDQNRTHDQFAQRIRDFGSSYGAFSTVAHSQGGAASLHLWTYYWSGLDYSDANRRIQSVGTPYQGTSLAGNLAWLGNVFNVGCGINYNLTYDGAALWLSGIPSWAKDDVNYYTTSFATKWWRYDYCSIATDAVLGDPEDGTTEKSKGQLPGGVNRGHKTGWCHTGSMRDPQQTKDTSRNSVMNSNGQRSSGATTPKIVVDGILDDWYDKGGNTFCEGDTCVATNQFSHLYLLTTAASGSGNVCTNLDTNSDGSANYAVCYDSNVAADNFVTLSECEESACTNVIATYPVDGFNSDASALEVGIGLADIGLAVGDTLCYSDAANPADAICYNTDNGKAEAVTPTAVSMNGSQANITTLMVTLLAFTTLLLTATAYAKRS